VTCPDENLGDALPASPVGSTLEEQNDFGGSCGGVEAPEATLLWSAPADGTYRIDTIGSTFDTVLYVLGGACEGPELACNDDADGLQSSVVVDLAAGELVTIVVDGFGIEAGVYRVHITAAATACPDDDLGMEVPVSASASTVGAEDVFSASCGGFSAPERTYLWTAPMAGEYAFDTSGSAYDTVLYVLQGICEGGELACDDDGGPGSTSMAILTLAGGQMVTVVVDGAEDEGSFDLNISLIEGSCPDADLGSEFGVVVGSTVGVGNTMAGSCGGWSAADASFSWTAPATATYLFDTAGSDFDTVLYLHDGGCDGPELACNDDASGSETRSRVVASLAAGQTVVATVDGKGTASGDFELAISELPCPDEDLASIFPYEGSGSTVGAMDKLVGSCQGSSSPDVAFEWTAPAAGTYTIDTVGSMYDTVLFVLDATCGGPELGCNDDTYDLQSEVVVSLAAGQTVVIVVDGYSGDTGDFVLQIN